MQIQLFCVPIFIVRSGTVLLALILKIETFNVPVEHRKEHDLQSAASVVEKISKGVEA